MRRRDLLKLVAASALLPRRSWAFGGSLVDVAEIDLPGMVSRPNAWERLLEEIEQTTSIETDARPSRVAPDSPDLFRHPFCVLAGAEAFEQPGMVATEQLARFLQYGGFLLIDDTSGGDAGGFDDSVRALCAVLFPTSPLAPLPSDHSLYRSFFMIDRPVGRVATSRYLEGVTLDGVEGRGGFTPLVYTRDDLSGALDRSPSGRETFACVPGGERQRREALKLAINLVMYCITTDYKKDQAHVKTLIEQNRLDADWDVP